VSNAKLQKISYEKVLLDSDVVIERLDPRQDQVRCLWELHCAARLSIAEFFCSLIYQIRINEDGEKNIPPVKGGFRLLEKSNLQPDDPIPWDTVRAMIVCHSMMQVTMVLVQTLLLMGGQIVLFI